MLLTNNIELAYAKINLYLKVVEKRADGFHNLEMLNTSIDFYDELRIEESNEFEVKVIGEEIDENNNLVKKILDYMIEKYQLNSPCKIILKKKIFVGAGLGGGSSDAAATLKLIKRFYNLKLNRHDIKEICTKFGSDIYFCYYQKIAKVYQTGDVLKNQIPKPYNLLVVYPNVEILSKSVFEVLKVDENPSKLNEFYEAYFSKEMALQQAIWTNDLEEYALKLSSELRKAKELLSSLDKNFRLTGSGSTYYLLSDDLNYLKKLKNEIDHVGYKTVIAKTVDF